jgi:hypothetical protein
MTLDEIKDRVGRVKARVSDPEVAHGLEDELRDDLLKALAEGRVSDPAAAAQIALETNNFNFPRWCA